MPSLETFCTAFRGLVWQAQIWAPLRWLRGLKNRQIFLGHYPVKNVAAAAHDLAALVIKGNHARLNFQRSRYALEYVRQLEEIAKPADIAGLATYADSLREAIARIVQELPDAD
eukprot:jgi/Botrbrau1/792/Bobra.0181s0045.1